MKRSITRDIIDIQTILDSYDDTDINLDDILATHGHKKYTKQPKDKRRRLNPPQAILQRFSTHLDKLRLTQAQEEEMLRNAQTVAEYIEDKNIKEALTTWRDKSADREEENKQTY